MCFYKHIMHSMNWIFDDLIISIIFDIILQLWLLTFDAYLITGLELHGWLQWKYVL
jgi:hypothetical protein